MKQDKEQAVRAELQFCRYSRDTERELSKTQGYFVAAVVALLISMTLNFMQWLGHQVPAL
jgi:hypothetical protein